MNLYTYDMLEKNGRLGNQLWQIAATICRAELSGGMATFKPDWEYRPYFSVPDYYFNKDTNPRMWDQVIDGGTDYFQDYANFEPIEDLIRQYFTPKQSRNQYGSDKVTCAIHVRRGDYLKHPDLFPQPTQRYFTTAVNDVVTRRGDVKFVVFSDDPNWCESNPSHFGFVGGEDVTFHRGTARPVEVKDRHGAPQDQWDMFEMIAMDEHIISNSTFSWWSAYLSDNRQPIYPNKWFTNKVPGGVHWENVIPSGWRKFSC
jgi:hypothetical protein